LLAWPRIRRRSVWLRENRPEALFAVRKFCVETLDRVYGHHHPDFLSDAADAIRRKPNRNQALVVSLVGAAAKREKLK
jgi:hypothetical protein